MKLTPAAFRRRRSQDRNTWPRNTIRRVHPGTGLPVIEPVDLVKRLLPGDCDHDDLRVVRAGLLVREHVARCRDCGAGGPVVPAGADTPAADARAAFFAMYPRASYRDVRDDAGERMGYVERIGSAWVAWSTAGSDAPRACVGTFHDADMAAGMIFTRWNRTATGANMERRRRHS
jgi:hypothetical protein